MSDEAFLTHASLLLKLKASQVQERDTAWRQFQVKYAPIIAAFASKCGANQQDIDDIIQDVITNFWSAQTGWNYDPKQGRFRGWLKTVTVRSAVRLAGKNMRFRGIPLENLTDVETAIEPAWESAWENQLMSEGLEMLRQLYGQTLMYRAFFELVFQERTPESIATELQTTANNVHQAKSRMTKQLKKIVERLRNLD
jgi:RNA polymerase sigma-70 factor, ECF subfamily